ncbi:hypothetical protein [Bradyrhizobium sp. BR 10289]|uniref:hypothetical protein n=1 Tax=Bradyrhizobium sp. BR 10289 TaxID=2749993 RepID=UPI001C653365|nr:hypothetical protein [Bradyrhizobium sp. BR 10289]
MARRQNVLGNPVADAPALAPGPASEGDFDGAVPAGGAARAERQSRRHASAGGDGATAPDASPRVGTLKERARQMSLYLEPATYDELREIAHRERTKMHVLLLQAVDQFLKGRTTPPKRYPLLSLLSRG